MLNTRYRATIAGSIAALMFLAGCSTKGGESVGNTDDSGVKSDFGVTDSEISLGVFNDQTGVLKTSSLQVTAGAQMWVNDINAKGGICGRDIKLEVRDHGYSTEKAVATYPEVSQKIAGFIQITGSGQLAALKAQLQSDNLVAIGATWSSSLLGTPAILLDGATYNVEMINGLAYLQEQKLIKKGDKIGHIYVDGEYGNSGLAGAQYFADENGMTLVPVKVGAADTDMAAAITQLKSQDVSAMLLTLTPPPTGSALTQAKAQGLDVPVMGQNPSFDPSLLETPAKNSFDNYYRVVSYAPMTASNPYVESVKKQYETGEFDIPESDNMVNGYLKGVIWETILKQACDEKDLTRANLLKIRESIKVDTKGVTAPLDLSDVNEPPTRASFVEKVDPTVLGGLTVVQEAKAYDIAKKYKHG